MLNNVLHVFFFFFVLLSIIYLIHQVYENMELIFKEEKITSQLYSETQTEQKYAIWCSC